MSPELEIIGELPEEIAPPPETVTVPIRARRYVCDQHGDPIFDNDGTPVVDEIVERFVFRPMTKTGVYLQSMRLMKSVEHLSRDERTAELGRQANVYIEQWLVDDDRERYEAFTTDPMIDVGFDTIGEVYRALVRHYAGVPTTQRSALRSMPSRGGATSRAAAGSTGSTSSASRSTPASSSSSRSSSRTSGTGATRPGTKRATASSRGSANRSTPKKRTK